MSASAPQATSSVTSRDRPRKPPPSVAMIAGLVAFAAITVWAGIGVEFTLTPLIMNLTRGSDVIWYYLHPNWDILTRPAVIEGFLETLYIAIIASLVGCIVALGISMLASKVSAPNSVVYQITKFFLSLIRSLPDIAYGLLFVAFVQTGALPGILALIVFNIGVVAKLTPESIDAVDRGPVEAVEAAGATRFQRARFAIFPQVAPNYLSYCFYVFELNLRASMVLGFVGAGGIGEVINLLMTRLDHSSVSAVVVALFVVVFVLDQASRTARRRLT